MGGGKIVFQNIGDTPPQRRIFPASRKEGIYGQVFSRRRKGKGIHKRVESIIIFYSCHDKHLPKEFFKKFPTQLSGGEAQRVAAVRAVINNPKILFCDEPTGALNSENSKAVLDVFSKLNDKGQSIVMVTHDITSAIRANRILYLSDGHIKGELKLDKYSSESEQRKANVKDFLTGLGW